MQTPKFLPEPFPGGSVQGRERFIKQEDTGFENQSTSQSSPLLFAAGKCGWVPVEKRGDAEGFGHLFCGGTAFGRRTTRLPEAEGDVFPDGHVRKKHVILIHHADATLFRGKRGDITSVKENGTTVRMMDPCNGFKQNGFSGTRRTQNDTIFPGLNTDAEVFEVELSQVKREVPDLKHRFPRFPGRNIQQRRVLLRR